MKENHVVYSVVIPVFNEEGNLRILYARLIRVMTNLGQLYELIFVDDGSTDGSFQVLRDLQQENSGVKVVRFTRNFGQHPAVMAGLDCARGEVVITMDADLQNPPEEIPKLLEKLNDGYEVVFCVFPRRRHPIFRRVASRFSKWVLSRILPVETTSLSGFRVMRSGVVDKLKLLGERSKFLDGLLCWMGFRVGIVEVEHGKRQIGKTKYSTLKLISLWFDMVVALTDLPLKIATFGGLLLGAVGFMLAGFYIIRYLLYGFGVPGFATIVILIAVFSSVQLVCLGILGEYIGRMNKEVRNRPEYIVRDRWGVEEDAEN
jgi:glycosyltransferase involved in cell wall biosynthesis